MERFLDVLPKKSKKRKSSDCLLKSIPSSKEQFKARRQMFLDLGQKSFGKQKHCESCGMVYVIGDIEDEQRHKEFCSKISKNRLISVGSLLKRLQVVAVDSVQTDSPIVSVPQSVLSHEKIKTFVQVMSESLGSSKEFSESVGVNSSLFLFVDKSKNVIIGGIVAEPVSSHCLLVMDSSGAVLHPFEESQMPEVPSVVVGVRQIWVHDDHRRRGVASKLVDACRRNCLFGKVLLREHTAFSQPTSDGLKFALNYVAKNAVLIYK